MPDLPMPDFEFNDLGLKQAAFDSLQCNILRGTGRARSTQVFRRFGSPAELKSWLTNTAPQPSNTEATHDVLVNLLFTLEALQWLGVAPDKLAQMDAAFLRGSRHVATLDKLGDGVASGWGRHKLPWHVVELHAHHGAYKPAIQPSSDCFIEYGTGIDEKGNPIVENDQHSYGHFGIRDGISKLAHTQADYEELIQANGGQPPVHWDPRHPLSALLVPDVATEAPGYYASYFVFRKFHQDVNKFEQRVSAIAQEIETRRLNNPFNAATGHSKDDGGTLTPEAQGFAAFEGKTGSALRDQIKDWIFGRGKHGATAFGTSGNDFNYDSDPGGARCPFHAHVRKMNPRGRTGKPEHERARAIARRGSSGHMTGVFGQGAAEPQTSPDTSLLFWCAQSSIAEQFEYIQEKWANSTNVDLDLWPTPDVDSVIGRLHPKHKQPAAGAPHWDRWKRTVGPAHEIWEAITLMGAEYFYAPSIEGIVALKALAKGKP